MPTIDWPSDACLRPSSVSFSVVPARSSWSAVYTRQRTQVSHLADRLRVTLQLPPCTAAEAAAREAWINYLVAESPWVRLRHFARPYPRGNARGTLTVGANAAAGVRSVTLSGARASPNLLRGPSFEVDSDANGRADYWNSYFAGTTGTGNVALSTSSPVDGTRVQLVTSTGLGTTTGDRIGIVQSIDVAPSTTYTISAHMAWLETSSARYAIYVDWIDAGSVIVGSSSVFPATLLNSSLTRYSLTGTSPATAVTAAVSFFAHSRQTASGAASFAIDAVQFEPGPTATPYVGLPRLLPGDTLSVGGNLLLVGYAGAVANDAGSMTVPLQLPLRTAVTAGAAVTWAQPTGTFQLETDAVSLEYVPGNLQSGFELSFLEVV